MAELHPAKKIHPAERDPIRIVPLNLPEEVLQPTPEHAAAAPAATPRLRRGGIPPDRMSTKLGVAPYPISEDALDD